MTTSVQGPFGRDHHARVLVQLREQVEQQGTPGLAEGKVSELVEDQHFGVHQTMRDLARLSDRLLRLERTEQFHRRLEAHPFAVSLDGFHDQSRGQVRLASARPADEDGHPQA